MITATLAVACALTAQVLTTTRQLNPANLAEVQAWYQRQFGTRARATQAATLLLILAALLRRRHCRHRPPQRFCQRVHRCPHANVRGRERDTRPVSNRPAALRAADCQ